MALNLGVVGQGGVQAEAEHRSRRGKGTVTWKQPDNGHGPHRENKAAALPEQCSFLPSFNMV